MSETKRKDQKKLSHAIAFAAKWHAGQLDKYEDEPYILHPLRVMMEIQDQFPDDVDMQCAAVLHDVLEDTQAPSQRIFRDFGQQVYDLVIHLTRGMNEKYFDYIRRVKTCPKATAIKLEDIADNMNNRGEVPEGMAKRYVEAMYELEDAE